MLLLLAGPDLPERATPSPLSIEPSNPGRHQRRGVALVAAKLGNMRRPTIDKNTLGVLSGENFRKYLESQITSTDKAVVRRCTEVLGRTIQICGGDFFIRWFHKDGYIIWRFLALSSFRRKTLSLMDERAIILPYRNTSLTSEEPMAEISSQKIQIAVLDMITEISSNKRSAIALESVLKKICGLVVGIAYGGLIGLREAAIRALTGLACMDADLVWLLLADVYHSLKQRDMPVPPIQDLVALCDLLPPPVSALPRPESLQAFLL